MKTLYHGTSSRNLPSIKTHGLIPGRAKGSDAWAKDHHWAIAALSKHRAPSVFVTDRLANAKDFARKSVEEMKGDPIVVTLHIPEAVFQTYVVDELFEAEAETPHAWRVPSVHASYVAEVLPVEPASAEDELTQAIEDLLYGFERQDA